MDTRHHEADALEQHYARQGYRQPHTLGQLLRHWAGQHGDATALVAGATRLSYAQLDLQADRLAAGFARLGVARGDRVLLQLPNDAAFVVCLFALLRLGALPIMAMPAHREKDLAALCQLAEPVAYVAPRRFLGFDYLPLAECVKRGRPSLRHIVLDGDAGPWTVLAALDEAPRELPAPAHTDTALLLLSGGTTGTPKLIPRSHADYAYNAIASARLCGLSRDAVYLAALPAAHNFPLACPGILGTLSAGGRVVMAKTPSSDEAFALIHAEGVSFTALVPPLVALWLEAREWDRTDLSSLKLLQVGGARLTPELAARIPPALGCRLQQVFGMAEGLLCYTRLDDPWETVVHTQGRPLCPDDEVRIVGADGLPVAAGEVGELQVRGPYTIRGYYRAPEQNARSFTEEGFYCSGDLVRLTAEGNIVVEGRVKEQINRAGEKIGAAEIERPLSTHPDVHNCVVVAVPDERLGERSCAVVIGRERVPTLSELQRHLGALGLPRYKQPDQVLAVPAWPLTTVGKIDKQRLVALALRVPAAGHEAAGGAPRAYAECRVEVERAPIDLCLALARAGLADDYTIYEQPGEWSIGLGRLATLGADAGQAWLTRAGQVRQTFRQARLVDAVAAATRAIDVLDWRAYGVARFELARVFHGLNVQAQEDPLLELFVPEYEVRIRHGEALLRAIDPAALARLQAALAQAERQAERGMPAPADEALADSLRRHQQEAYKIRVSGAVADINARRYQKVILSRRIPLPAGVDLAETYRCGRARNTPARSYLVQLGDLRVAGFSPETVVEVSVDGWVSTQPLAGTRALGANREEEARLREELLCDAKEVAEHAVSVKLAHDELATVCDDPGVSEFMTVSRRGSVQHLASRVKGRLREGRHAWDAFEALFPAVTASGIPKQAGIDAIQRYEGTPRGCYSGCVLIVDSHGAMDAALVLRSIYQRGGESWLQAGAGLVAQSTPERGMGAGAAGRPRGRQPDRNGAGFPARHAPGEYLAQPGRQGDVRRTDRAAHLAPLAGPARRRAVAGR